LWSSSAKDRVTSARVDVVLDAIARPYWLPLARASVQFEAAELLSAYAASHPAAEVIYSSPQLTIYHTPLH
jgi:hypothetical protein